MMFVILSTCKECRHSIADHKFTERNTLPTVLHRDKSIITENVPAEIDNLFFSDINEPHLASLYRFCCFGAVYKGSDFRLSLLLFTCLRDKTPL